MTLFFIQTNTIGVILKKIHGLPSFIMAVNGCFCLEVHKSASIHHKSAPHGSGWLIKAFWTEAKWWVCV